MNNQKDYSFQRYLQAKKSLDDRSLNQFVSRLFVDLCRLHSSLHVLELGCGTGTMLQRLLHRSALTQGDYLGIDNAADSIAYGLEKLPAWGQAQGFQVTQRADKLFFQLQARQEEPGTTLMISMECRDAVQFSQNKENHHAWDVLIAHAFLDLFNLPQVMPAFLKLLKPGGIFYFTLNFDGLTSLVPIIDSTLDQHIIELYHRSMDLRQVAGKPSGDSQSGRHLLSYLPQWGARILAAGASDWVVYPAENGYQGDDAYFLHHILYFFEQSLNGHSELDPHQFSAWLATRHSQVERAELVYIAHQLDILGIV